MRLVITGLEYSGKSSLGGAVVEWIGETMGQETGLHDHYWPTISHQELTDEEQKYLLGLTPRLKELVMRNNLDYHAQRSFYKSGDPDHLVVGGHVEDAVMGPFYYGYGGPDDAQARSMVNRFLEAEILENGPDTVLVHLEASADAIAERMNDDPHPNSVLRKEDVPALLERFREEVEGSRLRQKIAIDTSGKTVEQTLGEFVEKIEPHLTDVDKQRVLIQKLKLRGEWL
jgi:hypothetical protein